MIESVLWIVFVLACILVSAVILLQEGKGGGLGEAFGGAGQQAFGVKAEGINKFTGWVTVFVVVIAIAITKIRSDGSSLAFSDSAPAPPVDDAAVSAPEVPGAAPDGSAPAPSGEPAPAPVGDSAPTPAPTNDGDNGGDGK